MTDLPRPTQPQRCRPEPSTARSSTRRRRADETTPQGDAVTSPAKVMRIGSMVKMLLEEVRTAPLDEPAASGWPRSTSARSPSCPRRCRPTCSRS